MAYTIGIGVMLDEHTYNTLREYELLLFESNGNTSGLSQPPHITVKVPFEVPAMKDIEATARYMTEIAAKTKKFSLKIKGFGHFGDKVVFAKVIENTVLKKLSDTFITKLSPLDKQATERERMIHHSTMAMNLSPKQYNVCQDILANKTLEIEVEVTSLGLFLGINDLSQWIVIKQASLR
jgi:2'-5' RNA ligase